MVRVIGLLAVVGAYFAVASLLPERVASGAGLVAFATIAVGAFGWARRDGRSLAVADGVRDWLVVACVVAVTWWVALIRFEGAEDLVVHVRLNFLRVLITAGVIFAAAVLGFLFGREPRPPGGDVRA